MDHWNYYCKKLIEIMWNYWKKFPKRVLDLNRYVRLHDHKRKEGVFELWTGLWKWYGDCIWRRCADKFNWIRHRCRLYMVPLLIQCPYHLFCLLEHCFVVVQLLNHALFFAPPWTVARQALLSIISQVFSNSCPSRQWCYLTISSSATPFSFCLHSFPRSFPMSQLFASGGQSIRASQHQSFQWVFRFENWNKATKNKIKYSWVSPMIKFLPLEGITGGFLFHWNCPIFITSPSLSSPPPLST